MADHGFRYGDEVRVGRRGRVKWTVVTVGEVGILLHSAEGAWRHELPANLRRWQD